MVLDMVLGLDTVLDMVYRQDKEQDMGNELVLDMELELDI
jgi:hypothetical protein